MAASTSSWVKDWVASTRSCPDSTSTHSRHSRIRCVCVCVCVCVLEGLKQTNINLEVIHAVNAVLWHPGE